MAAVAEQEEAAPEAHRVAQGAPRPEVLAVLPQAARRGTPRAPLPSAASRLAGRLIFAWLFKMPGQRLVNAKPTGFGNWGPKQNGTRMKRSVLRNPGAELEIRLACEAV